MNVPSPACSAGMPPKLAVNGSLGGPATVADGLLLNGLGSFPRVHTAPAVPEAPPPGSEIVTTSRDSGSTVISHRSWRPSTRRADRGPPRRPPPTRPGAP